MSKKTVQQIKKERPQLPLQESMEIDIANPHKVGRKTAKILRFLWFMRNGLFSSSKWDNRRLLCVVGAHVWGRTYNIDELDYETLTCSIVCTRCHYKHKFLLASNRLFYFITPLIEVTTPLEKEYRERLRDAGVTYNPSNYEKRMEKKELKKYFELALKGLNESN